MARQLTFTTDSGVTASNTFIPQTDFVIVGMQGTSLNGTYQLQVRPFGSVDPLWIDFPSEPAMLTGSAKVLAAEGSPGFEYRFLLTTAASTLDGNIFYWSHVTNLQADFNR